MDRKFNYYPKWINIWRLPKKKRVGNSIDICSEEWDVPVWVAQGFFIMIWRSSCIARNWHMFWKETRCIVCCFLWFFVGPFPPLKHNAVNYERLCPSYVVCFIFNFFFLARKNKGCRNCRHWKETGRKKKRNRQKHFRGNPLHKLRSAAFSPICVHSLGYNSDWLHSVDQHIFSSLLEAA